MNYKDAHISLEEASRDTRSSLALRAQSLLQPASSPRNRANYLKRKDMSHINSGTQTNH